MVSRILVVKLYVMFMFTYYLCDLYMFFGNVIILYDHWYLLFRHHYCWSAVAIVRRTRSGWTKCAREHELCVWRLRESPPTLAVSNLNQGINKNHPEMDSSDRKWFMGILTLLIWRDTNIQYCLDFINVLFKITAPSAWYKKDVNWNLFRLNMVSSSPRCARPNRFASDMQLVMDSALIVSCRLIMQDYKISDSNAKLSTSIDYRL